MKDRALAHGIKRFRGKTLVLLLGSERQMQFGGSLAEQLGTLGIDAADERIHDRPGRDRVALQLGLAREHALIESAHGIERHLPSIPLARNRTLHRADNRGVAFAFPVLDRAGERGHVGVAGLFGEEARHFHVRIHAVFQLAVKFEEELVLEDHRRVALLNPENLRAQGGSVVHESASRRAHNLPSLAAQTLCPRP